MVSHAAPKFQPQGVPWRGLTEAFAEAGVLNPTDPEFERADVTCRVVGTPVYAAPEVWWNERTPQSYPADIWSAGVVIFEMLFGRVSPRAITDAGACG